MMFKVLKDIAPNYLKVLFYNCCNNANYELHTNYSKNVL